MTDTNKRIGIVGAVAAVVGVGVLATSSHPNSDAACQTFAHDQIMAWQQGKHMNGKVPTVEQLQMMQKRYYDNCMAGKAIAMKDKP